MLTDKSSTFLQSRNSNTILLELNPKTLAPHSQKLFPRRIKKLQEGCFSKKARTIKLLQSLELLQDAKNQTYYTQTVKETNVSTHKMSSYLIYKKEQQTLRAAHNFKLLHLKSKCFESKSSGKVTESACIPSPCASPKLGMKISNSLHEDENNYCKTRAKSRQFYIKTSEGKKRKLNTVDYQNKLRCKINQPKQEGNLSFQRFNQYSQSTFVTNFGQPRQTPKHQSCKMMKGRFNIKTKASSLARFNLQKSTQFRPWTSKKTERAEQ